MPVIWTPFSHPRDVRTLTRVPTVLKQAIEQLRKMCMHLIDLIATVWSAFLQRSDYLRREILKMIRNFPNAAVAPWSLATIWGGASLLKMLLRCMEDLMAKKDWKWDFFINLSESDYPIK